MKKKLNSIMLVDDDDDNNYIHERTLRETDCVKEILIVHDGREALNIINSNIKEKQQNPSIIFLDLNMPGMDGWEFLKEYEKLDKKEKEKITLIVLSTSLNPEDKQRAISHHDVRAFYTKFLDKKTITTILNEYFSGDYHGVH